MLSEKDNRQSAKWKVRQYICHSFDRHILMPYDLELLKVA